MYSIRKRVSKLMTFTFNFTTGLLVLIFLLTSFYNPELPKVKVQLNNVRGPPFIFDLDINLTNQFHLNVKQIFLYMKINYDKENNDIIWSEIIKRSSKKVISKRVANNYVVAAPRSQKILFELRGCIFPFVGKIKDVLLYKEEREYFPQIGKK
ncbi:Signal peptidase complex subunit [Tubulinosema ratisbonensis]|uniref:Signal peptidase complex subunit 3 n=1 Tax=Tubulinosema ratisbonensis TaxID=291195 RepID=A0A437APJ8_9MICR|nr:Signal peptidase complex subunit [Tubulinosema ratisbonensis]